MSIKKGQHGGLTDVPGILVGNAEDESGRTGCTVILCPKGAVPGAVIFDIIYAKGARRPDAKMGYAAAVVLEKAIIRGVQMAYKGYVQQ